MFDLIIQDIKRIKNKKSTSSVIVFFRALLLDNGFFAVLIYRFSNWCFRLKIPIIPYLIQRLGIFLTGVEISAQAVIGPGLRIAHGTGICIGCRVKIGKNAFILQGVTIGEGDMRFDAMPVIGDDVKIFAGAQVLGKVNLGNNVTVCANSVVVYSAPDNAVLLGIPAMPAMSGRGTNKAESKE